MKRAEYFFAYFNKKNINKLLAGLLDREGAGDATFFAGLEQAGQRLEDR